MRRLLIMSILAGVAAAGAGCQSTQQACCRPTPVYSYSSCNPCAPAAAGIPMESYGAPTVIQSAPGTIMPGAVNSSTVTPGPVTYEPPSSMP